MILGIEKKITPMHISGSLETYLPPPYELRIPVRVMTTTCDGIKVD